MSKLIDEIIADKLSKVDRKEKILIVDGKYFLHKSKSVYVELVDNKFVEYYIKVKDFDGDRVNTRREIVTSEVSQKLKTIIASSSLGNYVHSQTIPTDLCQITVDGFLDFLIIESPLYYIARQAIPNRVARGVDFKGIHLDSIQLHQLINEFKVQSYDNYYRFMYSKLQKRIMNKCYKKKQFFNILHAFIPVAIHYNNIYNPLLDDPADTFFYNSKLVQTAINKNRKVEVNDSLYCYMLTHEEICLALGLNKFMRFTPEFLYRLVVGLLHPEIQGFPTKTRKVYVHKTASEISSNLKNYYSEEAFNEKLVELASHYSDTMSEDDKTAINKEIAILNEYANMDMLYFEIERHRRNLLGIGGNIIENASSVTTEVLYDILFNAQLLMEV